MIVYIDNMLIIGEFSDVVQNHMTTMVALLGFIVNPCQALPSQWCSQTRAY